MHSHTNTATWEMKRWFALLYNSNVCGFLQEVKKRGELFYTLGDSYQIRYFMS